MRARVANSDHPFERPEKIAGVEVVYERLQRWYLSQCDGEWEHRYGVQIQTLDNPGWMLDVDLVGTGLEDRPFPPEPLEQRSETDWIHCRIENRQFRAAGGPTNLTEMIERFLAWAKA